MRIEVSVPGIRKERGKLPAPTTLGALELEFAVTDAEVGAPVAAEQPVKPDTIKNTTIRARQ